MASTAVRVCWVVAAFGVLFVGLSLGIVTGAAIQEGSADDAEIDGFDEVKTEFAIQENGSAAVTVEYRYALETDTDDADWESLRADIDDRNEEYRGVEAERWNEMVTDATAETDREMTVGDVDVTTETSTAAREYGHVEVRFVWDSFARVELNRIEAGDALEGYVLDDESYLLFSWPEGYTAESIDPAPDERRESVAGWDGEETEFVEDEPRVDLIEANEATDPPPENGPTDPAVDRWLAAIGGLALLVAVALAAWAAGRARSGRPTRSDGDGEPSERTEPPPELLSNEEQVLRVIADHGGRVKQQAVVSELDWTEAKTSQVVGTLRETGDIEVFRIGRENVLTLPEDDEQ